MTKKIFVICAMLLAAVLFSSCSCDSNKATPDEATADEATTAQKVVKVDTPYGDLSVSEDFDKALKPVVRSEDPYIVDFVSKADDTKVLALHFNDKTPDVLGTFKVDGKDVVLYAEFPDIDKNNSHYQEYNRYQMDVSNIADHLEQDYDFVPGKDPGSGDSNSETYDIKTSLVTLKYPKKWKDKVTVTEKDNVVSFTAGKTPLFDLYFKEADGVQLGTYGKTPVYIKEYKVKENDHKNMIQDVNVIIDHLIEDKNFVQS